MSESAASAAARLTQAEARMLIARRLRSLGHPPDLLDPSAISLLTAHAAGDAPRLRAGLAALLFLASTEDAARIDAALVRRALPQEASAGASRRGRAIRRSAVLAGAAAAILLAAMVAHQRRASPPPPAPPPLDAAAAPARPAPLPPAPKPGPIHSAATVLPPLPPAIAVRSLPVPPQAASLAAAAVPSAALPPPAVVKLRYRDRLSQNLPPLLRRLRAAGVTDIRMQAPGGPAPRRVVSYFYVEDRILAEVIANAIRQAAWPVQPGNSLLPALVLIPAGLSPRPPGTIEVQLP